MKLRFKICTSPHMDSKTALHFGTYCLLFYTCVCTLTVVIANSNLTQNITILHNAATTLDPQQCQQLNCYFQYLIECVASSFCVYRLKISLQCCSFNYWCEDCLHVTQEQAKCLNGQGVKVKLFYRKKRLSLRELT